MWYSVYNTANVVEYTGKLVLAAACANKHTGSQCITIMTVCTASWMQTAVYHKTVLKLYFRNITYSFQQKGHVYYTQYIAGKNLMVGKSERVRERNR